MPSPAERSRLEWALRAVATGALAWLVIGAFLERTKPGGLPVNSADLPGALGDWTVSPPADTIGLPLAAGLDRATLDYLRALRANSSAVIWMNQGILPLMLEAEPLEDPAGGVMARVSAPRGSILSLSDSLGVLDSLSIDYLGEAVRIPAFSGAIEVSAGSTIARAATRARGPARSIVVLGMAGWESKFVIRALDERGWTVESRVGIAPRLATLRGKPFPLDTARHATVIALDSSAATFSREIRQFVRAGGGLVLGPGAEPYFARSPSEGSTVLQRDRGGALAAWRTGSGRVIRISEHETWRWRMAQEDTAVAGHRDWWSGLVSAVAYRSRGNAEPATPAPLAALVQELGPPGALPGNHAAIALWPYLLTVFLLVLFAEWLSRRLRGEA